MRIGGVRLMKIKDLIIASPVNPTDTGGIGRCGQLCNRQFRDIMNTTPRVSIGLIVYNGENFLEQAITSLLAQTFTDF